MFLQKKEGRKNYFLFSIHLWGFTCSTIQTTTRIIFHYSLKDCTVNTGKLLDHITIYDLYFEFTFK